MANKLQCFKGCTQGFVLDCTGIFAIIAMRPSLFRDGFDRAQALALYAMNDTCLMTSQRTQEQLPPMTNDARTSTTIASALYSITLCSLRFAQSNTIVLVIITSKVY